MQSNIEKLDSPSLKRTKQLQKAPLRTKAQWLKDSEIRKEREKLAKVGKAIGEHDGKVRDLVLHLHGKRIQDLETRLAAAAPGSEEHARVEAERNSYLLDCGSVVVKFSASTDNNERRQLTIDYLQRAGDSTGAHIVAKQWAEEKETSEPVTLDGDEDDWHRTTKLSRHIEVCAKCGGTEIAEDRTACELVCLQCGSMTRFIPPMTAAQMASNVMHVNAKYSYNRASHFRDRILQWLGMEFRGDLSQDVIDRLLLQLRKERVTSVAGWSKKRMVSLLKRAGLNEYYEHSHHFISQLSGKEVPFKLDNETIEVLMQMFAKFEQAYEKHKHLLCDSRHPKRKNIITLSYVLRKFMTILGLPPEYCESFPMLKNVEKIRAYEVVFKKCCEDLGWPFIPSL